MAESGCLRDMAVQNLQVTGTTTFVENIIAPNVNKRGARLLLEEYFHQRPALNAVATAPLTNADGSHNDNDAIINKYLIVIHFVKQLFQIYIAHRSDFKRI